MPAEPPVIEYVIQDPLELNLSYITFVNDSGLFVPTADAFVLGDRILVDLRLPGQKESLRIEGKVVWITPKNALHHVLAGIGIQFIGKNAKTVRAQIESLLDPSMTTGGYVYGITEDIKKINK